MSPTLRRRLAALEARQAQREPKPRRRCVWWDAHRGDPPPAAELGEELHVLRWMLPDEKPAQRVTKAAGDAR
jgi:hypothetical protein